MRGFLTALLARALMFHLPDHVAARSLVGLEGSGTLNAFDDKWFAPPPALDPVSAHASSTSLPSSGQDSGKVTFFARAALFFSDSWNKLSGFASSDNSEVPGPSWIAMFALAASLCAFCRWVWIRKLSSRFDFQPDITVQRKLFDAASGWKPGLWQVGKFCLRWIATFCIVALALKYADTSYGIIGCFAASALAYERQQSHLLIEGQKKLGLDLLVAGDNI